MAANTPLFPSDRPITSADTVYQWLPGGGPDRVMPPGSKQSTGWLAEEQPPAQWFNGLQGATAGWVTFFDTMIPEFNYSVTRSMALGYSAFADSPGNNFTDTVAFGYEAGSNIVTTNVFSSTFIGNYAGREATGPWMVGVGYEAGKGAHTGSTSLGYRAGSATVLSEGAVYVGQTAGLSSSIVRGVAIGYDAANSYADGEGSVSIGYDAGKGGSSTNSVNIGQRAGSLSIGIDRVNIGQDAGYNTVGTGHPTGVNIGSFAGSAGQGFGSVHIGSSAGLGSDSAGFNVAVGLNAAKDCLATQASLLGAFSGINMEGQGHTGIGYEACAVASEAANPLIIKGAITAIGHQAFQQASNPTYAVNGGSIFLGTSVGKNFAPPSEMQASWAATFAPSHSVLSIGLNDNMAQGYLTGYYDPSNPHLSLLGTKSLFKIAVTTAGERSSFTTQYGGGTPFTEAIGALTLDSGGTELYVFTSTGFKSVTIS